MLNYVCELTTSTRGALNEWIWYSSKFETSMIFQHSKQFHDGNPWISNYVSTFSLHGYNPTFLQQYEFLCMKS